MNDSSPRRDGFDRSWSAFSATLLVPIQDRGRPMVLALIGIAFLAILLATSPALFLDDMALDVFIPLDGALRMNQGQWPHQDFYTPIGALYYGLLWLAGPGPMAPVYANLWLLPLGVGAAWILTRHRLPTPLRVALFTAVCLHLISPRTLDSLALIGHLASYNRHGWGLVALVMAGVLLEPTQRDRRWTALEIVALTACVVATFYLKITFFALAGAVLLTVAVFGGVNRKTAVVAGASALAVIGLGFVLGDTNALYVQDLRRAASAGSDGARLFRPERISAIVNHNGVALMTLVVGCVWMIRTSRDPAEERGASRAVLRVLVVLALALLVASQSHDLAVPVVGVLLTSLFAAARERAIQRGGGLTVGFGALAAMTFAWLSWPVVLDSSSVAKHTVGARVAETVPLADLPRLQRIRIPVPAASESPLSRVIAGDLPPDAYDNLIGVPWKRDNDLILRDAVALLREHDADALKVASLTFSPSFPWILDSPPPRHLPAWYDYRRTMTADMGPAVDKTLSDSEAVLVPKVWRMEGIWTVFGPQLERDFVAVDDTPLWTLWLRR